MSWKRKIFGRGAHVHCRMARVIPDTGIVQQIQGTRRVVRMDADGSYVVYHIEDLSYVKR